MRLAGAGFRRWSTYRQAALAGAFTNTVFGVIKVSLLFAVAAGTGGAVAGYDRAGLSTYAWTSQALIAVVYVFGWTGCAPATSQSTWRGRSTCSWPGWPQTSAGLPSPSASARCCPRSSER
jgi:hypothetical protein